MINTLEGLEQAKIGDVVCDVHDGITIPEFSIMEISRNFYNQVIWGKLGEGIINKILYVIDKTDCGVTGIFCRDGRFWLVNWDLS